MQIASLSACFALLSVAACSVNTTSPDDRTASYQVPTSEDLSASASYRHN